MSRFRVTMRGSAVELRGYVDGEANLVTLGRVLDGQLDVMIIASPVEDDYNPFGFKARNPDFATGERWDER